MHEENLQKTRQLAEHRDNSEAMPVKISLFRDTRVHLILAIMTMIGFIGGYFTHAYMVGPTAFSNVVSNSQNPSNQSNGGDQGGDQPVSLAISVDDDPFIGPADAPITIIEFSDYECPFCKRFRDETLNQILTTYEGQIRFVYRDFPLSQIHPRAQIAAEVANCAGDQDRYWTMHDILFADQQNWSKMTNVYDRFTRYATELNMDAGLFIECIKSGKYADEVQKDYQDGVAYGVTGTPSFFINGKFISGAVPFQMFQAVIERELFNLNSGT